MPEQERNLPADSEGTWLDAALAAAFGVSDAGVAHEGDEESPGSQWLDGGGRASPFESLPDGQPASEGERYELLGEIARGGMGRILKGRDTRLGRELAMKVLLESHRHRPEAVQRFLEEARIGCQLQHPGILPVYEVGELADRSPYFTMRIVEGQTLSALLAERQDLVTDRARLLTIFLHVCQTLDYAHSRGIIHRDLKPSNIMVGPFGEVQVMDWGLAKSLGPCGSHDDPEPTGRPPHRTQDGTANTGGSETPVADSVTRDGSVLGTPAYMAPEQARGEVACVDERGDVFGLGAILCQILTGEPPYVATVDRSVFSMAQQCNTAECLARLETSGVEKELAEIAAGALSRDPADRPRDAGVMARQISQYVNSAERRYRRAELARAQAMAVAREERKRRRLTLALAASLATMAMIVAGGWSWIAYRQAARQERLNQRIHDALIEAAQFHQQSKAVPLDDSVPLTKAIEAVRRAESLVKTGSAGPAVVERVQTLLAVLDSETRDRRLIAALEQSRMRRAEWDRTHSHVQSMPDEILAACLDALQQYGLVVGATSAADAAARIARRPDAVRDHIIGNLDLVVWETRDTWLGALVELADTDPWRARLRHALRADDTAKLQELAREPRAFQQPAPTVDLLARGLLQAGANDPAIQVLERAQMSTPGDFWINTRLAAELQRQGRDAAQLERAIAYQTAAVALRPDLAGAYCDLAHLLNQAGRLHEARKAVETAIGIQPMFAAAHTELGLILQQMGQYAEAIEAHRRAIEMPHNHAALEALAAALLANNQPHDAVHVIDQALAMAPLCGGAHYLAGRARKSTGQRDEAERLYRQALALDPRHAAAGCELAAILFERGNVEEAEALFGQAHHTDPVLLAARRGLANCYLRREQWERAAVILRDLIPDARGDPTPAFQFGFALQRAGQLDDAIAAYRQAIQWDPDYAEAHCNLGGALLEQGRLAESLIAYRQGDALGRERTEWNYPSGQWIANGERLLALERRLPAILAGKEMPAPGDLMALGRVCFLTRRYAESVSFYRRALDDDALRPGQRNSVRLNLFRSAVRALQVAESSLSLADADRHVVTQQLLDTLAAFAAETQRRLAETGGDERNRLRAELAAALGSPDLAPLRDPDFIRQLPEDHRQPFQRLAHDIDRWIGGLRDPPP